MSPKFEGFRLRLVESMVYLQKVHDKASYLPHDGHKAKKEKDFYCLFCVSTFYDLHLHS